MICVMDHSVTYLDSDDDEVSIWPWIIALFAIIGVLITTVQTSKAITADVAINARDAIVATKISGVLMDIDGRDVTLSGTIDPDVDKRALIERISDATGVRRVVDQLTIFDPEVAAKQRSELFQQQLASLDFGALAFTQGSAVLTNESGPALDALTQLLLQFPEQRIRVAGHTDNTGRPAVNLRISQERADTVGSYLISRGVATSQVVIRGFGASRPIADNSTEAGRARNRRIEITDIN